MRLGLFADVVYRVDGRHAYTDRSFIVFVTGLAPRLGELVLFGRCHPEPGSSYYLLPESGIRFVPLPHYARLTSLGALLRSVRRAKAAFEAELEQLDAVFLFGPHPLSLVFTWSAWRRGVPVVQGVRQDWPRYIQSRLPSRLWWWAVAAAQGLEGIWRLLALRLPTVVVGEELGRRYARPGARVLVTGFSLIRESEIVPKADALAKDWTGTALRILTVTRLDAEKNVLLLPEILALLRKNDERWRLTVAGEGVLEQAIRARARELGVEDSLDLVGYVPSGPSLWQLYRRSHAFLHVSRTEGLPQVLFEAKAAGLPIVATDVGGVSAALGDGAAGLLIPPDAAAAAVHALEALRDDPDLRNRLIGAALSTVTTETMEAQLDRLTQFILGPASPQRDG
jgi:glycosyltransferase involved in cell wall biosynthesis